MDTKKTLRFRIRINAALQEATLTYYLAADCLGWKSNTTTQTAAAAAILGRALRRMEGKAWH